MGTVKRRAPVNQHSIRPESHEGYRFYWTACWHHSCRSCTCLQYPYHWLPCSNSPCCPHLPCPCSCLPCPCSCLPYSCGTPCTCPYISCSCSACSIRLPCSCSPCTSGTCSS